MFFRLFAGVVFLGLAAVGLAAFDYFSFLKQPVNAQDETLFVVKKGWSAKRVSNELVAQNLIDKPHWFNLLARLEKKATAIKVGEYPVPPDMTPPELLELLQTGQAREYSFSIIEGSTFKQLKLKLEAAEHLQFSLGDKTDAAIMEAVGKPGVHPEGQFFADTYRFPNDTLDLDFLKRASEMLDKVLQEEWDNRSPDLPLANPYEALILASIVEKETAVVEERPLIAQVFLSRINLKMRLQTDPTVIYGMGDSYDGNIRRKDLTTDTPYNTYTRGGLPPSPISMVGREAIHAVLHPEETTALYFVARGDGTHQFSDTVEQHNAAVRKYQLKK